MPVGATRCKAMDHSVNSVRNMWSIFFNFDCSCSF